MWGGGGGGLVQRAVSGPTEWAGFRNGMKGPQFFGPKSGPNRRSKTQKAMGRRKLKRREEGQQIANTDKACLVGSGPALIGPNPKAQRQDQKGPGRQNWGLKAVLLGPKDVLKCSAGETKCEDEGVRPGEKGTSNLDALVDLAWICAKGPLLDAHEERTGLKDCDRFESCGKLGLWEMSSECSFLISPCQGTTENGSLNGQVLDLVERGSRGSEVEVAEDYSSRTFSSRCETFVLLPFALFLADPFFLGVLLAWGITMGMR